MRSHAFCGGMWRALIPVPLFDMLVVGIMRQLADVDQLFRSAFAEVSSDTGVVFSIEDRDFGVLHKLEDLSELYDGAVVEAKLVAPAGRLYVFLLSVDSSFLSLCRHRCLQCLLCQFPRSLHHHRRRNRWNPQGMLFCLI